MTNYLSFETDPRVVGQFVLIWQAIKDNYFQVEQRVKKQKLMWSEIVYQLLRYVISKQIVRLA